MAKPKTKLYIAYGSNLNKDQMEHRCPTAEPISSSVIKDHQLMFRGGARGAVATVESSEGAEVPVGIWKIRKDDEEKLDIYEGYPHLYRKETLNIELNGENVEAMAYVMNDGREMGMPSRGYLRTIAEGYQDFGLDINALQEALDYSHENLGQVNTQDNDFNMKW